MNNTNSININLEEFINETSSQVSEQEILLTDKAITNLGDLVEEVGDLVSFSGIYHCIRELMDNKNSRLEDFALVVSSDPCLTANILKIVNSVYFDFAGQIDDVPRALNLIGTGELYKLVLYSSANESQYIANEVLDMQVFWQQSLKCGMLARLFAEELQIEDSDSMFLIGLLHEIGHLILYLKFPKESIKTKLLAKQENRPLYQVEMEFFGVHYGQVGQELMKKWNFPEKFQSITGYHPEPSAAQQFSMETTIVHIAHIYALAEETEDATHCPQELIAPYAQALTGFTEEQTQLILNVAENMSTEMEKMILG